MSDEVIFNGERPYIGQSFTKDGVEYKVASIGVPNIIIGLKKGLTEATRVSDLITIKEVFK